MRIAGIGLAAIALVVVAGAAGGGGRLPVTADGTRFVGQNGERLYHAICQGCHMGDARGATGAASYPSLRDDVALSNPVYPIYMILNGREAMPGFHAYLSDDQIAAIVNYLRTHFGNHYREQISAVTVHAVRARGSSRSAHVQAHD